MNDVATDPILTPPCCSCSHGDVCKYRESCERLVGELAEFWRVRSFAVTENGIFSLRVECRRFRGELACGTTQSTGPYPPFNLC